MQQERQRLAFRLNNAPVDEVVKSLAEFIISQQQSPPADESAPRPGKVILVPEQVTNTLLVSGPPKLLASMSQRIAKLDERPDMVDVQVIIAKYALTDPAEVKMPSPDEDGTAWLESASKQGRLEVLSRPQVMTLVNQPASIQVGSLLKAKPEPARIGITVGLTPRVSPERRIIMELDVERASLVGRDGAGEPIIGKATLQTTISAKDGQMVIAGGMIEHTKDGRRQLIIAVTPRPESLFTDAVEVLVGAQEKLVLAAASAA